MKSYTLSTLFTKRRAMNLMSYKFSTFQSLLVHNIIVVTTLLDTVHHRQKKIQELDLPPYADERGRGRTYSMRPVTRVGLNPYPLNEIYTMYTNLQCHKLSLIDEWDTWSIKENLKIPLKTSGLRKPVVIPRGQ
jgi:hypothetical protein